MSWIHQPQSIHFPLNIVWLSRKLSLRFLSAALKHNALCSAEQKSFPNLSCSRVFRCLLLSFILSRNKKISRSLGDFRTRTSPTQYEHLIMGEDNALWLKKKKLTFPLSNPSIKTHDMLFEWGLDSRSEEPQNILTGSVAHHREIYQGCFTIISPKSTFLALAYKSIAEKAVWVGLWNKKVWASHREEPQWCYLLSKHLEGPQLISAVHCVQGNTHPHTHVHTKHTNTHTHTLIELQSIGLWRDSTTHKLMLCRQTCLLLTFLTFPWISEQIITTPDRFKLGEAFSRFFLHLKVSPSPKWLEIYLNW